MNVHEIACALMNSSVEVFSFEVPMDLAKMITEYSAWDPWFVPAADDNKRWHKKFQRSIEHPAAMQCNVKVRNRQVLILQFDAGDTYRVALKVYNSPFPWNVGERQVCYTFYTFLLS